MSDTVESTEETATVITSYQVSWTRTGQDKPRTVTCVVDDANMKRPSDVEERDQTLRKIVATRYLPIGEMKPENVKLLDVQPVCNCAPYPGENCVWAVYKGHRFTLTPTKRTDFESIYDRGTGQIIATVSIAISVEVLTLVRHKYGHR